VVNHASGRGNRTISLALRFEVFRRDSFTCQYCGQRAPEVTLHVDHAMPHAAGGRKVPENLVTACSDCNLGKDARRLDRRPEQPTS
jgi:5-methylcytosine-specific restriction endonuclease McrA